MTAAAKTERFNYWKLIFCSSLETISIITPRGLLKLAAAEQTQAFDAVMSIKWYDSPRHRLVNRGGDRDSHDARVNRSSGFS